MSKAQCGLVLQAGFADGPILALDEPLSFWGGVDPTSGRIIDTHHLGHGLTVSGTILLMPTSRGSCSGSGVLLDLVLSGKAPAALVFQADEDVLTLGALVAAKLFERTIPVLRLSSEPFDAVSKARRAEITPTTIHADGVEIELATLSTDTLSLGASDQRMLDGDEGDDRRVAMEIVCAVARRQGAAELIDVTRAHIDGCIYASPANLRFAERMQALGAKVAIPTTMNAISVDRENWRRLGVPESFGTPAQALADSYVAMGCRPRFTCAPYLLDDPPRLGEPVAWSESNAVIFANSVLGARTPKHPDLLDLCLAITGRAPRSGVYCDTERQATLSIHVEMPDEATDVVWPLIGYCAGLRSPEAIPRLRGLAGLRPTRDDLKALCAAFGTTSAAPMQHIEGVTPEAGDGVASSAGQDIITRSDLAQAYARLNAGPDTIELVAIGSPHASASECRAFATSLAERHCHPDVTVIVTAGRSTISALEAEGTAARLAASGVQLLPDLCWCSIVRPVFPVHTKTVLTNSGKYAHYGPGLSGCAVRLGTLADCVEAALTGRASARLPDWLS